MSAAAEPLTILYQDEWLVAVDKPAGHLVHPADQPREDDLVTMKILRDQIGQRVYNIHRIDRPTTGVLLFGIDRNAARALHRAFERHEVQKTYRAISLGCSPDEPWECKEALRKKEGDPIKEAWTSFQLLSQTTPRQLLGQEIDTLSLIKARPHTGRYHQIRRHLLHHGLPIVGDYRYAGIDQSNRLGELLGTGTRMLLQSKQLTFIHPVKDQNVTIEAPTDALFGRYFPEWC